MKINIEFDTEKDSKCLIEKILSLIAANKCTCGKHKHEESAPPTHPAPSNEVPVVPEPTDAHPEPAEPVEGKVERKCECCGKIFYQDPRHRAAKYCSKSCCNKVCTARYLAKKKGQAVENVPAPTKPVEPEKTVDDKPKAICKLCEMPFTPFDKAQIFCHKCIHTFGEDECKAQLEEKELSKHVKTTTWKVCPKCGSNFNDPEDRMLFCPKCMERANNKGKKKRKHA